MGEGDVRAKGRGGERRSPGSRTERRYGREREGRKEGKKSQGEVLRSLTTKMEERQGQIVGDDLTAEGCTCLIFPDIRGHQRSLPDCCLSQLEVLKDGEPTSYTWRTLPQDS